MDECIQLTIPAHLKYLNVISATIAAFLEREAVPVMKNGLVYNMQLAVHEVATNIIEHAYSGQFDQHITLEMCIQPAAARFVIRLRDQGHSFNLGDVATPELGTPQERGLGLFIVNELMDEVQYDSGELGNTWTLTKTLSS